jgi:ubiquinone/menaquinone biosynthesis C-methylase UbiE
MKLELLHRKQKQHMEGHLDDPSRVEHSLTWFREDTTDYWRHNRMHLELTPILEDRFRWITFGDGRYGTDARFLLQRGQDVLATDVTDELLKIAHARGFIREFAACNAEATGFADGAFDWAYCKESYHHFPRPPVAFYEMLRVVRRGLVLQEPSEHEPRNWPAKVLLAISRLRAPRRYEFEPSGNFLYKISRIEIAKMLLGVGLKTFFVKHIYDHYVPGVERETFPGPLAAEIQACIARQEHFARTRGIDSAVATMVIPKEEDAALFDGIERFGYRRIELPRNPHL